MHKLPEEIVNALNHEWYKMNNKLYAYTGCKESYEEPMDFEDWSEEL